MRKANVKDYRAFALEAVKIVGDRPISFEVFSDDFSEMEWQARTIASWGNNVYVKLPVTNTRGQFAGPLIRKLASAGVQLNVTALMTLEQVEDVVDCLNGNVPSYVSVFAGRVADTGRDPLPLMKQAVDGSRTQAGRGADLGQPARAAQRLPRRFGELPHHHGHQRHSQQAQPGGQGPDRLFAGHGQDVLQRRHRGWVCH